MPRRRATCSPVCSVARDAPSWHPCATSTRRTARIVPSSRSSASASESRCRSSATSRCCPSRRCSTDYPIKARKRPSRRLDATGGSFHAGMMRRRGERREGDGYGKGGAVGAVMRFAWVTDGGGQG